MDVVPHRVGVPKSRQSGLEKFVKAQATSGVCADTQSWIQIPAPALIPKVTFITLASWMVRPILR
jgi:hypothetical protein